MSSKSLADELDLLRVRAGRELNLLVAAEQVVRATKRLRAAQQVYMTNRGDELLGSRVAEAAGVVDATMVNYDRVKGSI